MLGLDVLNWDVCRILLLGNLKDFYELLCNCSISFSSLKVLFNFLENDEEEKITLEQSEYILKFLTELLYKLIMTLQCIKWGW